MLARRFFAAALFVLPVLAGSAALAAPSLEGVNLGESASGPKLKAADLKGRVVVFEYWGQHCGPCLASVPHLASIQAKYPYKSLLVVANQCQGGDAANAAKVWADHQGGPKVAVVNGGNLPGANVSGIPRVFVFDAFGKCVFEGSPMDGKFDAAIEAAARSSPSAAVLAKLEAARTMAKDLFGNAIAEDLMPAAMRIADTAQSSEDACRMLEKYTRAKDPKLAEQAKFMLETFNKAVAGKYAAAAAKVADEPAEAWSAVDATAKWAPQSPESAKARADMSKWMRDPANLKELAADKLWLGLKTQAAKIDFEKHPEAKPTNQMESDLRKLIKEHPQSKALAKARQTAAGWKLDPETGRTEPSKAASKSAAKPAALGASAK